MEQRSRIGAVWSLVSAVVLSGALMTTSMAEAKACKRDSDCLDHKSSTLDWCEDRRCMHVSRHDSTCRQGPDSCSSDSDCQDGNGETVDWCQGGLCHRANREDATCPAHCRDDKACRDGDGRTIDWCEHRQCYNLDRREASCLVEPDSCTSNYDCKDHDSATIEWCADGRCYRAIRDGMVCESDSCRTDDDCKDSDPTTVDWCTAGTCQHIGRGEETCLEYESACKKDVQCRDGDSETVDWCHDGSCFHAARSDGSCNPTGGFEVVEYEYLGDCEAPVVPPTISLDGRLVEMPFEGTGFEVLADRELNTRESTAECFLLVTIALPRGRQIAPAFIDVVGEADLDDGAEASLFAQYRLIGGGELAAAEASATFHGPLTDGVRAQGFETSTSNMSGSWWSECGQRLVTFRIATHMSASIGEGEFGELSLTNAVGGNRNKVTCGYSVRNCW